MNPETVVRVDRWWVGIATDGVAVRRIFLLDRSGAGGREPGPRPDISPLTARAARWLAAWLDDPALPWPEDLPLSPAPTPFQRRVRAELLAIPPGQTTTYGALAKALGTAPRAVGGACRANPVPLAVPCHRVVAASGIGGFSGESAGPWPAFKEWLLAREGAVCAGRQPSALKPRRVIPIG